LRLNRTSVIVPLAGGAIGIGMFTLRGGLVGVFGIVAFFTAMIISASMLPTQCLLGERKHQTLAFLMSLPLSSIQYTIAKMLTVLGIFLAPWLTLVIAGVWIILGRADVPNGLLPLFLALCLLVLAGMCVIASVDLVSESESMHQVAAVVVNVSYSFAWLFIAVNSNIRAGIQNPVPVWDSTILLLLGGELAFIAALLGLTLFLQSRKKDFI
jgi:ABC-2 type transport system permease protein